MISHRNVICNVLQATAFDSVSRKALQSKFGNETLQDVQLGLLPFNHIYALVLICHAGVYRGDRTVVLPKFEIKSYLNSIHHYRIQTLYLVGHQTHFDFATSAKTLTKPQVPPILIMMTKQKQLCEKYNLTSVQSVFTGAAPMGAETADQLLEMFPKWHIRQGYGQ